MSVKALEKSQARDIDLAGRERHLQVAVAALNQVSLRFSRGTRRALPFLTRQRAKVTVGEVIIGPSSGNEAQGPSVCSFLESADGLGWAALRMDSRAINMVLEGTLGAMDKGDDTEQPTIGMEMTAAQRALVTSIVRNLATDFATTVRREVGWALKVGRTRSYRAGEAAEIPNDVILSEVRFEGIAHPSTLQLLIGAEGLEGAIQSRHGDELAMGDPRMAEIMREVEVPVRAELGRVSLGLRRLLALRPGETLRLPTAIDDPITIRVADVRKFEAVPVISRGQVSVRIGKRTRK